MRQLAVLAKWPIVMDAVAVKAGGSARVFFFVYRIGTTLLLLPLFVGYVIESFTKNYSATIHESDEIIHNRHKRQGSRKRGGMLDATHVTRALVRHESKTPTYTLEGRARALDVDMKVVGFGDSEADLKKLVKLLQDENRDLKQTVHSQTERIGGLSASVMTMSKRAATVLKGGGAIGTTHEEKIAAYKKAFSTYDKDGDGTISTTELGTVMESLGEHLSAEELLATINDVDADGSGSIDFNEFRAMMQGGVKGGEGKGGGSGTSSNGRTCTSRSRRLVFERSVCGVISTDQIAAFKEAFSVFDIDGDGTVNTGELGTVMQSLGENMSEKEIQQMISGVDTDGSGSIDFTEFLTMMRGRTAGAATMDDSSETKASPG